MSRKRKLELPCVEVVSDEGATFVFDEKTMQTLKRLRRNAPDQLENAKVLREALGYARDAAWREKKLH